jgi:hypothetical protein
MSYFLKKTNVPLASVVWPLWQRQRDVSNQVHCCSLISLRVNYTAAARNDTENIQNKTAAGQKAKT